MRRLIDRLAAARREDRGFTLIELLIVIIILGVLAAIVVFSVRGISNNSKASACKTEIRTVETAIEAYYAKVGSYPATVNTLTTSPNKFLRKAPDGTVSSITGTDTIDATTGELTPAPAAC